MTELKEPDTQGRSHLAPSSMVKVIDYDKRTGKILRTIYYYDPEHVGMIYPGCLYLQMEDAADDALQYVSDRKVVDRARQQLVVEGQVIKGIGAGASIVIEGSRYTCDGSDVHLSFTHPGVYTVTVEDWPYLDWSADIENIPQQ